MAVVHADDRRYSVRRRQRRRGAARGGEGGAAADRQGRRDARCPHRRGRQQERPARQSKCRRHTETAGTAGRAGRSTVVSALGVCCDWRGTGRCHRTTARNDRETT